MSLLGAIGAIQRSDMTPQEKKHALAKLVMEARREGYLEGHADALRKVREAFS